MKIFVVEFIQKRKKKLTSNGIFCEITDKFTDKNCFWRRYLITISSTKKRENEKKVRERERVRYLHLLFD